MWRLIPVCFILLSQITAGEIRIKLATTTSVENSGLLDTLLPPFERLFKVRVDVIAVGTGQALKLGENGEVDVILVHAKKAEEQFIDSGFGLERQEIMFNDFVIVGDTADPAAIKGSDAAIALRKISEKRSPFFSRGDESGTHKKEQELWAELDIKPEGKWYLETGQGMGPTLLIANEKRGYCLADRGTYLALKEKNSLIILCAGDKRLYNPYSIITINPARYPGIKYDQAMKLIKWLGSPQAQKIIGTYQKHGTTLFYPTTQEEKK